MVEIALRPFERSDFARLMDWIQSPESLVPWAGPTFSYLLDLLLNKESCRIQQFFCCEGGKHDA